MKRIYATALLAALLSALNLACQKAGDANWNQKAAESNANKKTEEATAKATPAEPVKDEKAEKEQLLNDLVDTVHRFNTARNRGETATQERLLANEFKGLGDDGKTYTKEEWIDSQGLSNFASHKVENAEVLNNTQYTATMSYDGRTNFNDGTPPTVARYTVTFVKRDGRWQIKSIGE